MYINGKWYEQPELQAYVNELEAKVKSLEDQVERLQKVIARNSEEEYD